ncbi:MAG: hypothetical protein ACI3VY_02060 [Faecousia sp.]
MLVKIVSGIYGYHLPNGVLKPLTPKDAPVEVDYGEAIRLINLGIAKSAEDESAPVVDSAVATPCIDESDDSAGVNISDTIVVPEGKKTTSAPKYRDMTVSQLRELCDSLSIDWLWRWSKADYIATLDDYYA